MPLTEFEILCCAALIFFDLKKPRCLIIEVGMGGKRDATNIFDCAKDCLLTSVSLDHTEFLGSTVMEIAREKMGILRRLGRLFSSSEVPTSCISVIRQEVLMRRPCPIYWIDSTVSRYRNSLLINDSGKKAHLPLKGDHQLSNSKLVSVICRKQNARVLLSLEYCQIKGRLQSLTFCDRLVIVDGAHNASGLAALSRYLSKIRNGPIFWIVAFSGQKENLASFLPCSDSDILCFTHFGSVDFMPWVKVTPKENLVARMKSNGSTIYTMHRQSVTEALLAAVHLRFEGLIVITGSLYLSNAFISSS